MNNNENDENQDLQRENLLPLILKCLGWAIFRTYPALLRTNAHGCQFGQRITLMPICVT